MEKEPDRPYGINGHQLKSLEIKNIFLFNSICYLTFQSLGYFPLSKNNKDVPSEAYSRSLKPNLFQQFFFAF